MIPNKIPNLQSFPDLFCQKIFCCTWFQYLSRYWGHKIWITRYNLILTLEHLETICNGCFKGSTVLSPFYIPYLHIDFMIISPHLCNFKFSPNRFLPFFKNISKEGQWYGLVGQGPCCLTWPSKFCPSYGKKQERTPINCPLTSTHWQWHVCTRTCTHKHK